MPLSVIPADASLFFKGRAGDPRLGELVQRGTLPASLKNAAVILGYPDDTGVTANRGRAGAARGPDSIRKHFYKMTPPADVRAGKSAGIWDAGNSVVGKNLGETHDNAKALACHVAKSGATGLVLGGGHDFACPTLEGFASSSPGRWGLLNVDPHLDTRELEGPFTHSGNPFRVLIEKKTLAGRDFVEFGARVNRNTRSSWEFCRKNKVTLLPLETLREKGGVEKAFALALGKLTRACRFVGLTIDMDTCSDAEGTSAAPVLGFSAWELCRFATLAAKNPRVRYLEIAEVAPALDTTERSSRIAAEILYAFARARGVF